MKNLYKARKALVFWTLIALSVPLFLFFLSDSFCLREMLARAERRELDGHFRNLTAMVAAAPVDIVAVDEGTFAHPDLLTMSTAGSDDQEMGPPPSYRAAGASLRPFLRAGEGGGSFAGLLQTVALGGGGAQTAIDVHAATFGSGLPVVVPAVAVGGPAFADFKRKSRADAALFLTTGGRVKPVAATRVDVAWLADADLRTAANGGMVLRERQLGDLDAVVMAGPVHDETGRQVGVAVVARDRAGFLAAVVTTRNVMLGIGMLLLFVGISIACATMVEPSRA